MIFSCNQRYGNSDVGRRQAIVHSLCSHALYRHSHPSSSSSSVNTRRQRDPALGRLYRTLWSLIITDILYAVGASWLRKRAPSGRRILNLYNLSRIAKSNAKLIGQGKNNDNMLLLCTVMVVSVSNVSVSRLQTSWYRLGLGIICLVYNPVTLYSFHKYDTIR